jgi:hypothetical protein
VTENVVIQLKKTKGGALYREKRLDPERYPLLARDGILGEDQFAERTSAPVREVWSGLVAGDNLVEISGPSGEGKTTLAVLLAVALANPELDHPVEVLGRTVVPIEHERVVVFIEEENGTRGMRAKVLAACEALGLDPRGVLSRMLLLVRRGVRLGDDRWRELGLLARAGSIGGVFIDSRARVLRRPNNDADDEHDQAAVAADLFNFIEQSSAPMFVLSHLVKGRGKRSPDLEDIAGSGQRGAGADVVLLVTATKGHAGDVLASTVRVAKLRDDVENHPAPIMYAFTRDGVQVLDETPATSSTRKRSPTVGGPTERVRGLLERSKKPLLLSEIRQQLDMSSTSARAAITALGLDVRTISARAENGRQTEAFELVRRTR